MTGVWALAGTYAGEHYLEAHFWLQRRMFVILSPSLSISFWIAREKRGKFILYAYIMYDILEVYKL